jgi:C4-dicarboxylate-binding protein DctP
LRKKTIWLAAALTLVGLLVTACGSRVWDSEQIDPHQEIIIRFSYVVAEDTPEGLAAQRFADLINERTDGRVEVEVFPKATLYDDDQELQALRENKVQMIAPATSNLAGLSPSWQLLDLPYAFSSQEDVNNVMDGPIGRRLFASVGPDFKVLAFWDGGFKEMTNSQRPLVHPRDFDGLRMRTMINNQVLQAQFETLGAEPVPGDFSGLYSDLQTFQVDGEENTASNIYSQKFYQVQKYMTVSNHGYLGYAVLVNASFWRSLPPDTRLIIEQTMDGVTMWERHQATTMNDDDLKKLGRLMNIHYQTPAEKKEWETDLAPLYQQYAASIGPGLMEMLAGRERGE